MGTFDAKDPVRLVYEKIVATLKAFAPLTGDAALVKVGVASVLDYSTTTRLDPRKTRAQTADYPVLELTIGGGNWGMTASGEVPVQRIYELRIATGDLRICAMTWVQFQIVRALWAIRTGSRMGYSWVNRLRVEDHADEPRDEVYARKGWASVARVVVDMVIPDSDMEV